MLEAFLFFGFPVDNALDAALRTANSYAVDLFINNDSEYLHDTHFQGQRYLGKCVGQLQHIDALDLTKKNIHSLVHKLVPDYTLCTQSFVLFSITKPCPQ